MVGDTYVDVQTARNAGVASCGVTYGFQPETFREFPPDVLVDRLEDFADRFISHHELRVLQYRLGRSARGDRMARPRMQSRFSITARSFPAMFC